MQTKMLDLFVLSVANRSADFVTHLGQGLGSATLTSNCSFLRRKETKDKIGHRRGTRWYIPGILFWPSNSCWENVHHIVKGLSWQLAVGAFSAYSPW